MQQLSLFDSSLNLAGVMPSVKAAMRRIAGEGDECRKGLVDKLNQIAGHAEVRLTTGNSKFISLDTLNKMLSPSDTSHPASVLFVLVFCKATKDYAPLRLIAQAAGFDLMNEEQRMVWEMHKADMAERAAKKKKTLLKKMLEERL